MLTSVLTSLRPIHLQVWEFLGLPKRLTQIAILVLSLKRHGNSHVLRGDSKDINPKCDSHVHVF